MLDNLIFKQVDAGDLDLLIDFMNTTLQHNVNKNVWDWEYGQNKDTNSFCIIRDDKEIYGTQGFIPVYLFRNHTKILTGKSETSFVNSRLRGQNAFEKLYELGLEESVRKGHQLCWGFTLLKKVWSKKLHFEVYDKHIHEARLVLNVSQAIKQLIASKEKAHSLFLRIGKLLADSLKCQLMFLASKYTDKSINVTETIALKDEIECFLEKKYNNNVLLIRLFMDSNFINWRITQNPASKYKGFYYYRNNTLIGYSFLNITNKNNAYISDFNFQDDKVARHILTHNLTYLKVNGFGYCNYFGNIAEDTGKTIFDLFTKTGAAVIPNENMHFVLKNLNPTETFEGIFDMKNWYINGLMTEGFRI